MSERIQEKLAAAALPYADGAKVRDVRIGLGYTAVRLFDDRCGLAYTFRNAVAAGCTVLAGDRPLAGRPASELIELVTSRNCIAAAVGMATINALCNTPQQTAVPGDIMEAMHFDAADTVGMIGNFIPLVRPIRSRVETLHIFEQQNTDAEANVLPAEAVPDILPQCGIAVVTATALLNGTIDSILAAAGACREVVLLGATTPLTASVFVDTPVTFLSGVVVTDIDNVMRIISEGGGMRVFKPHVQKVNLRVE